MFSILLIFIPSQIVFLPPYRHSYRHGHTGPLVVMPKKSPAVAYGDLVTTPLNEGSLARMDAPSNDNVLQTLHSDALQYKDVEALVVGLNPQRAQDILMSYRILSTLSQYLEETNSWAFCLLNNYDFQNNVRQFDLDVAIVVGKRAEHLLAEIHAWNIPRLKSMVASFKAYYSDEATILTIIVFRIVSKYSDLEFTLQLALSRATLIKIHYEMAALFSKLPGGAENRTDASATSRNDHLVDSYRHFVAQLLQEIETSPFESVQQELFQVVRDLRSMFSKFSDTQMLKSLEDSPQENTFFDINQSATLPPSKLPPLAEDWQEDHFRPLPLPKHASTSASTHKRTLSNSTVQSSATAASSRTMLSDDLPQMMQAFELARKREEYAKLHQQNTTPPETPVRSNRSVSSATSPGSPISPGLPQADSMNVKMVAGRMVILVDGKYIDMQDWAAKVNSQTSAAVVAPVTPSSTYGLGSLFQPWLRAPEPVTAAAGSDKQVLGIGRKPSSSRLSKSQSIDNILSKQMPAPTSTLELLRASSLHGSAAGRATQGSGWLKGLV